MLQVRSPGQWRGIPDTEFWACSIPHSVQNCLGAMECLLRDGHISHEEGESCNCCQSRYLSALKGWWTDFRQQEQQCCMCTYFITIWSCQLWFFLLLCTDWLSSKWICYWRYYLTMWSRMTFFHDIYTVWQTLSHWQTREWLMNSLFHSQWNGASVTNWHLLHLAISGGEWHS